ECHAFAAPGWAGEAGTGSRGRESMPPSLGAVTILDSVVQQNRQSLSQMVDFVLRIVEVRGHSNKRSFRPLDNRRLDAVALPQAAAQRRRINARRQPKGRQGSV